MPVRPQCTKIAMAYYKETAYGTAVTPDTNVDKAFEPEEPILINPTRETVDNAAFIKGHEFPDSPAKDILIAQDVQIPFSFAMSTEVLGLLLAYAMGDDPVAGTGPYVHSFVAADLCATDQFPSTSWILGMAGDTASFFGVKGLIINELTISANTQGYLMVSGTAFTDGTLTAKASFTFPALVAGNFLTGTMCDFLIEDQGTPPVTQKSLFRGFEFSINNNLDVAEARALIAAAGVNLSSLRAGNREYSLSVQVEGHQGDAFWTDFTSQTEKDVQLTITKDASNILDIRARSCICSEVAPSFDGMRDVLDLTYKLYYNATDSSPVLVTLTNGVANYMQ